MRILATVLALSCLGVMAGTAEATMQPQQTHHARKGAVQQSPLEERLASLQTQLETIGQRLKDLNDQLRLEIPLLGPLQERMLSAETEVHNLQDALVEAEVKLAASPTDATLRARFDELKTSVEAARQASAAARSEYDQQVQKVMGLHSESDRLQLELQTLLSDVQLVTMQIQASLQILNQLPSRGTP